MTPNTNGLDIRGFAEELDGVVVTPEDDAYDRARRIWNGRLDSRPAAIAGCEGPEDVEAALNFARREELDVAVRGGGHSYAGKSVREDGLVIDLSEMARVEIREDSRTARVGPGATWGDVDRRTQEVGLGVTGATVSTVGVGGYTLGGGTGHLARCLGLAADNLVAAEVVTTTDGLVRASEHEHPELFWALRGGGGNFGVVTSFTYRLHEVGPELLAGQIVFPYDDAPSVLRGYREVMAEAPDELNCYAFFLRVPPDPAFPEEYHGEPAVDLVVSYAGEVGRGRELVEPLRGFGDPILDAVVPQSYVALQQAFDPGVPPGLRWFTRAQYLTGAPDEALDLLVERCRELAGTHSMVYLEPLGGAIGRVDPGATAFPHRSAPYSVHVLTGWTDPGRDDEVMGWTRRLHDDLAPFGTGGVYVNLLAEDEEDRVGAAYGANLERLRRVKGRWDPNNELRGNHNVEPSA